KILAHRASRRSRGDRYQRNSHAPRRPPQALQRPRCGLALGCRRGASPRYCARRGALPRYSAGAFSFPCESLTGRRRKRVRRRVRTGLSAKTAPAVRASPQVAEAQRPCRALPSHASRRVLPGARRLGPATAAQSPATPLGTHLQLRAPSPVPRLPHPTRIRHPLETPSEKGKVSLIYWTSTRPSISGQTRLIFWIRAISK